MSQSTLQFLLTCTSNLPLETLITEYDPLVLAEISLMLTNMLGGACELNVECAEIVAAEEYHGEEE